MATKKETKSKRAGLNLRSKKGAAEGASAGAEGDEGAEAGSEEDQVIDEESEQPFLFRDIDRIVNGVAALTDSHERIARKLDKRITELETYVSARFSGMDKAITALCKIVDGAARDNAFREALLLCDMSLAH